MKERPDLRKLSLFVIETKMAFPLRPYKKFLAPRHDQAQKSTAEVPEIGESKAPFFLLGSAARIWSHGKVSSPLC